MDVDKSVIRPIAAAIGAAALVFVLAPGVAAAKDTHGSGKHSRSHSTAHHRHGGGSTPSPVDPNLNRPQPTTSTSPGASSTPSALALLQAEIAALDAKAQAAGGAERDALMAQLSQLELALQLLKSGVTPPVPPVTPATPPPPTTPAPTTPVPGSTAPAPAPTTRSAPAGPSGPTVLTIGPSAQPGLQPVQVAAIPGGGADSRGTPIPRPSASASAQDTPLAVDAQPIPGLSRQTTDILFWIVGAFAAGILALVVSAGHRGRRRA